MKAASAVDGAMCSITNQARPNTTFPLSPGTVFRKCHSFAINFSKYTMRCSLDKMETIRADTDNPKYKLGTMRSSIQYHANLFIANILILTRDLASTDIVLCTNVQGYLLSVNYLPVRRSLKQFRPSGKASVF